MAAPSGLEGHIPLTAQAGPVDRFPLTLQIVARQTLQPSAKELQAAL